MHTKDTMICIDIEGIGIYWWTAKTITQTLKLMTPRSYLSLLLHLLGYPRSWAPYWSLCPPDWTILYATLSCHHGEATTLYLPSSDKWNVGRRIFLTFMIVKIVWHKARSSVAQLFEGATQRTSECSQMIWWIGDASSRPDSHDTFDWAIANIICFISSLQLLNSKYTRV
jgi:hypothetical protein